MKPISWIIIVVSMFLSGTMKCQDITNCRKVVNLVIESINEKSPEKLSRHLSSDFTIAGQKGEIAKAVLNQLLLQLNDSVKNFEETGHINNDSQFKLNYAFEYEKMGLKEATFIFNENNLLKELSLFKMKVKTMKGNSEVKESDQNEVKVPFTLVDNLIIVEALLNGKKRNFILDSGSPKVILNSKYLEGEETDKVKLSSSSGIRGSISGMDIQKIDELDFYGIRLSDQEVLTLDMSHIEKQLEVEIYGLLGYDLIKNYDLLFDYQGEKVVLINHQIFDDYYTRNLNDQKLIHVPFRMANHIPVLNVNLKGQEMSFGIDCGAEAGLIDAALFPKLKKLLYKVKKDTLIGADNIAAVVKKGEVKCITIGEKEFNNVPMVFSSISHLNEGDGLPMDGLIGYQILSAQRTLLSFKRNELIFIE